MNGASSRRWFCLGCAFELALLGIAVALGWLVRQPLLAKWNWRAGDLLMGIASAVPLLVLFWWMLHSRGRLVLEIRDFLEAVIRPIFSQWSVLQLAVISVLAGVCEESLFRAVIQGGLTHPMGVVTALVLTNVLFGACHFVNWAYAITATLIGLYLSALWLFTDNLLAPAVAHAVYDFAALVYFLRIYRPQGASQAAQNTFLRR